VITRVPATRAARPERRPAALGRLGLIAAGWLVALPLAGCFDRPPIEDRWTRLDIVSANVAPEQGLPLALPQTFSVRATVTYRAIVTGFAVAELRATDSLAAGALVSPNAPRVAMAQEIDAILASSRSLGRQTRAITGWDHLIQPFDLSFTATLDSRTSRYFLLCYLGSGQRLELPSGADSIVITPFQSAPHQLLPVGMELHGGTTP